MEQMSLFQMESKNESIYRNIIKERMACYAIPEEMFMEEFHF